MYSIYEHLTEQVKSKYGLTLSLYKDINIVQINLYNGSLFHEHKIDVYGVFDNAQEVYDNLKAEVTTDLLVGITDHLLRYKNIFYESSCHIRFDDLSDEYKSKINAEILRVSLGDYCYQEDGEYKLYRYDAKQVQVISNKVVCSDIEPDYSDKIDKLNEIKEFFNESQLRGMYNSIKTHEPLIKMGEKNIDFINEVIDFYGWRGIYDLAFFKLPSYRGYEFISYPKIRGHELIESIF
jgi:hypothetical protein